MQGAALGHLVVLVVLLGVIVVGLLEQRLELGSRLWRKRRLRLRARRRAAPAHWPARRSSRSPCVVDGVGAVDDALAAGRAAFRGPAEIARARIEGARRQPVDAADIGVHFRDRRRRLRGGLVRQGKCQQRREENNGEAGEYRCTERLHIHTSNANGGARITEIIRKVCLRCQGPTGPARRSRKPPFVLW